MTTTSLKAWRDQIQRENRLKDITIRGIKCSIDTFFKYQIKMEVISASPLTTIFYQKPAPDVNARNILSEREITDLLASAFAFSPGYLYPLIKFFTETAAKPSEVIDLTWQQVDLDGMQIHFPRTESSQERKLTLSEALTGILEKTKKKTGLVFMTYPKLATSPFEIGS